MLNIQRSIFNAQRQGTLKPPVLLYLYGTLTNLKTLPVVPDGPTAVETVK